MNYVIRDPNTAFNVENPLSKNGKILQALQRYSEICEYQIVLTEDPTKVLISPLEMDIRITYKLRDVNDNSRGVRYHTEKNVWTLDFNSTIIDKNNLIAGVLTGPSGLVSRELLIWSFFNIVNGFQGFGATLKADQQYTAQNVIIGGAGEKGSLTQFVVINDGALLNPQRMFVGQRVTVVNGLLVTDLSNQGTIKVVESNKLQIKMDNSAFYGDNLTPPPHRNRSHFPLES